MKNRVRLLLTRLFVTVRVALSLSLVLTFLGCGESATPGRVEFRIPVEVHEITLGLVEDLIVTTGTLRPLESVILNVETPGFLVLGRDESGNRFVEGDAVASGTLIAQVTGEDARLAARLKATRQHLQSAEQEKDRREQLLAERLIAEEDVWRARARYEEALHDYETSMRTFEKAQITTPISGVLLVLARDMNGRPMADGQKVLQGFEVARIAPVDTLIADVDLVGPELARVQTGQNVRISHYAYENTLLPGHILRLSPMMDERTHTFRAEVQVDNKEGLLKPGMFIEARVVVDRRDDVIVVPRESVTQRSGRDVVFVIDGQRVSAREVQLGLGDDQSVQIQEGVIIGERVVIRGLETLTDSAKVRVIGS